MRHNFEVRPRVIAHLILAQGHPWMERIDHYKEEDKVYKSTI
jgi:hypothetical protein